MHLLTTAVGRGSFILLEGIAVVAILLALGATGACAQVNRFYHPSGDTLRAGYDTPANKKEARVVFKFDLKPFVDQIKAAKEIRFEWTQGNGQAGYVPYAKLRYGVFALKAAKTGPVEMEDWDAGAVKAGAGYAPTSKRTRHHVGVTEPVKAAAAAEGKTAVLRLQITGVDGYPGTGGFQAYSQIYLVSGKPAAKDDKQRARLVIDPVVTPEGKEETPPEEKGTIVPVTEEAWVFSAAKKSVEKAEAQSEAPEETPATLEPVALDDLPPARALLRPDNAPTWKLNAGSAKPGEEAKLSVVDVEGQPFKQAARVALVGKPSKVGLRRALGGAFASDDAVMMVFYARALDSRDETGEAKGTILVGKKGETWSRYRVGFSVGKDWKRITFPFQAWYGLDPESGEIGFDLASFQQTIEIGGVQLLNYEKQRRASQLPQPRITYKGREPDAPWRKEAARRIEQHRKGDLRVRVTDAKGKPLAGAQVAVRLKRHDFQFGTAVAVEDWNGGPGNGKRYYGWGGTSPTPDDVRRFREHLPRLFNTAVLGDLKWIEGTRPTDQNMRDLMQWLDGQGLYTRGHVMVWPGWENLPKRIKALENDKPALKQAVVDRINNLGQLTKGKMIEWDVVNEVQWNNDLMRILGNGVMADWFKQARANDPKPRLFINEAMGLSWGELHNNLEKIVRRLQEQNAPVDGIGVEAHHGSNGTNPESTVATIDRLSKIVPHVAITEYDMDSADEQLQADNLRDLVTATFSHPAATGFIMWGFWDGGHWKNNAPLFRKDWTPKPALAAWENLVTKQWMTNVAGKTGNQGAYAARGFTGDYEVTVTRGGKRRTVRTSLPKEGRTLSIVLP